MPKMNYELFFYALLGVDVAIVAFTAGKGVEKTKARFVKDRDED